MYNTYNLYNFEADFKNYLLAGNISPITIKNYLSDFRHFAGWFISVGAYCNTPLQKTVLITGETVAEYKSYMVSNKIPEKTVKRRLSTLRKFCSFCISQGWMKTNPAKEIGNQKPARRFGGLEIKDEKIDQVLSSFKSDLQKEGTSGVTIKNYLVDVKDFLSFCHAGTTE